MGKMIGMMVPKDRIRSTAQIDPSWLNGLVLVDEVVRMPGSSQEGTVSVMFVFFSREQGRKILDEHRSSLHSAVLCSHRAKLEDSPLLETSSLQLLRWTGYAAAALRERIQAGGEDGGSFSIETTDDKPHVVQLGMMSPSKDPYPQEHVNGFILLFDEQGCHLSILYSKEQARTLVSRYARSLIPKNVRDYQDVIARSGLAAYLLARDDLCARLHSWIHHLGPAKSGKKASRKLVPQSSSLGFFNCLLTS